MTRWKSWAIAFGLACGLGSAPALAVPTFSDSFLSIQANGHEFCNGSGGYCESHANVITNPNHQLNGGPPPPAISGPNAGGQRVGVAATGKFMPTGPGGFKFGFSDLKLEELNGSGADVTIALTYTGLTQPQAAHLTGILDAMSVNFHGGGGLGTAAVQFAAIYADSSNTAFGMGTLVASKGTQGGNNSNAALVVSSGNPSGSVHLDGSYNMAGATYSVTLVLEVKFATGSNGTGIDIHFNAVPEPATLALFGIGLLMIGWAFSRRRIRSGDLLA